MKIFNYFFVMLQTFSKERIKSSLRCSEYNELLNGTVFQSIYDYNKMERMDDSNPKMINEFDYYNVTRHALKYGAYTNHLPRDDFKESKKRKKIKRPNKKKYVEDAMKKINKKEDFKKKDKPIVFLVSPEQLHHYKVYNKTMNRNKQKEIDEKNNNKNSTKKLADDFDDDDYYIWF